MKHAGDILVIDDYLATVQFIADALTEEGYAIRTATNAAEAQLAIAERRPDLVLVDLHLPDTPGDTLARDLKIERLGDVPVVIMTADTRFAGDLAIDGIAACLIKPFALNELIDCVATYIHPTARQPGGGTDL